MRLGRVGYPGEPEGPGIGGIKRTYRSAPAGETFNFRGVCWIAP
jgi:hypothetical protein